MTYNNFYKISLNYFTKLILKIKMNIIQIYYMADFIFSIGFLMIFFWIEKSYKILLSKHDIYYPAIEVYSQDKLFDIIYDQLNQAIQTIKNSPEYMYNMELQEEIIDLFSKLEEDIYTLEIYSRKKI